MDYTILSAIISASVALFISILNFFVITPIRENKERVRKQVNELYAPLYGIVCARLIIIKGKGSIHGGKLMLGSLEGVDYTERSYMEKYLLDNSGYASDKLMSAGLNYLSDVVRYNERHTYDFITTLVKEYNAKKKKLKLDYNINELETGIPECVKELRVSYKDKF